jgi:membrane protein insertase Oxa1/YidC/SpoIIIJ
MLYFDIKEMAGSRSRWPWVEILFFLVLLFAGAAFFSRGTAYLRWLRGESTGVMGPLSYILSVLAFGPFLGVIALAPNPELSEEVPRQKRRQQIMMFVAMAIIFCLEVFFLTF